METIKELANKIYQEEKGKHTETYQTLATIGKRLFDEYGIRDIDANNRYLFVKNVKVFDIKAV